MTEVDIILSRKHFSLTLKECFSDGITGIYGPSGSGKTTMLQAISGLAVPDRGMISIGGRTVFSSSGQINLPVEKRSIGYVFQEGRLFPHMTVERNLTYGLKKNGKRKLGFDEVIELLKLGHILKHRPCDISGGERQRTALGRSLLSSPEILLLDEPFSAVDAHLRNQIILYINRIHQQTRLPILVVSHDLPDLLKLTNTLCLLRDGRCMAHGTYYEMLKEETLSEMIGSNNVVNALDMKVIEPHFGEGLTLLGKSRGKDAAFIKCHMRQEHYQKGQDVKLFVNANDIALSTDRLKNITVQNQLRGQVTEIIEKGARLFCSVNVGFDLVVEITREARKRLNINKGTMVWCLFKAVAIDVAGFL